MGGSGSVLSGTWITEHREGPSGGGEAGTCARGKRASLRWLCRCFLFFLAEILSRHIYMTSEVFLDFWVSDSQSRLDLLLLGATRLC